jgi:hypothetical protein
MMMPSGSTSFTATISGRVQPTWRWINFTSTIPSTTKFKKIRVHVVYACKHDGCHKARLCANGNLTEIPINSVYSGAVSLKSLRTVIFLAELNGLETWATNIGYVYLEAETSEKVFIRLNPRSRP